MAKNKLTGGLESSVQVDGRDQRFKDVRQQAGGNGSMQMHALAQEQEIPQVQIAANSGAGPAADHGRLNLGEVALLVFRKAIIKLLADDQSQHGVAQELHALIGCE